MYRQVSHCRAAGRMGMASWEKKVEFKLLCVSTHTNSCLSVIFFLCCYTRCWYTSVSHLEDPLDENCSLKFQKLGLSLEGDFSIEPQQTMIVIPRHQGFIEGDQTLAMGRYHVCVQDEVWGKKERGRQGLLQCTYTPVLRKCSILPPHQPFFSIKEPIITCSQRNMLRD